MKKLITTLSFLPFLINAQSLDLGLEYYPFSRAYIKAQVNSKPIKRVYLSAVYGYQFINNTHKAGALMGVNIDSHLSIIVESGLANRGLYTDFGMKVQYDKGMYFTLQASFPGLCKFGVGYSFKNN
tara:strand:+ start:77 stop:454 length:378 start_codon:yes stop_codon:yes gene_type:complete